MKLQKTEEDEQSALFQYASYQKEPEWKLMFSIPNGVSDPSEPEPE